MNLILTVAKRELKVFFDSLIAYVMLLVFLGFSGFFTWLYGNDIFLVGQANLKTFFAVASWTLFFFIPAITMKMIAEEKKSGTLQLILTKSISDRQFILGKFFGAVGLVLVALIATFPYVITLSYIGDLDNGGTICGYFGLFLMTIAYTAIGIFSSSLTNNQIVAFMLSLVICLFFHIIFDVLSANSSGFLSQLFETLSLQTHFDSISRGVIDSKDLVYFLSLTVLGLFLAELSLTKSHS
jgi:ABC-2 type transport system permease protein